tara:strand:+ start:119 stop:532 length:414 start_codon:yes stop_codon:yes gene_type:complete
MAQFNTKNKSSRVARRWFSDIDINMSLHPDSKDLSLKYDLNAIKRSMKNILLTNHYERPFKPSFGVNLRSMLFELASNETKIVKRQVVEAIESLEPRCSITEVDAFLDGNEMNVTVHFGVQNVAGPQRLDLILQRVR